MKAILFSQHEVVVQEVQMFSFVFCFKRLLCFQNALYDGFDVQLPVFSRANIPNSTLKM